MKYKVGDKVKIKSLDWYNANKTKGNEVYLEGIVFLQLMSKYCGKVATIIYACRYGYSLDIDGGHYSWIDEMFEENINDMETKEIIIPQGWEIDKVKDNKIILKESKKELPKTWEECIVKIKDLEYIDTNGNIDDTNGDIEEVHFNVGAASNHINDIPKGLGKPMLALMQLLVCREVYRQEWKPDWTNANEKKYCITNNFNETQPTNYYCVDRVLSFQSAEIRDQFLENFKDLIKEAKELI